MVATGSHDIVANKLFVPERYMSPLVPPVVTAGANATYLMRLPVPPFLSLTAAIPALGAARRATQLYRSLIGERVRFGTQKVQSQSALGPDTSRNRHRRRARCGDGDARSGTRHRESRARRTRASAASSRSKCD